MYWSRACSSAVSACDTGKGDEKNGEGAAVMTNSDNGGALGDEILPLTKREHALLLLLARNRGRVLTHRQILTAIWGHAHTEDVAYLRVYIGQLRRKLGEAFAALIVTEPGIGYRLEDREN